jgi:hypothetical protein
MSIPRICYFVRENPSNSNILAIATVDGSLLFLNIETGDIMSGILFPYFPRFSINYLLFLEKRISAAINDLLFSDDGIILRNKIILTL